VPQVGKAITGVRIGEDPFTVQLRDSRGQYVSLRKSSLRTLTRMTTRSPMPAFDKLPEKALEDLVAYLASLQGAQQ
jgi:cytochrome c1